ncbi:MAG: methylcrotonoyl-CoA carboxylase [Bacteroidales bacterium]|nr:methylcrotonoyl-CoA carboxylase [Bacteroidales bacterium]
MLVLKSSVKNHSEEFKANYKYNKSLYKNIQDITDTVREKRDDKIVAQHKKRGKLLAHERIKLLIDKESDFLEFSPLAAYQKYSNRFPGAGIITGLGIIHGRETIIIANDATVKGGTYVYETIKKHLRAQEIALQNNIPVVYLIDSGGIYLPEQANVYPDKDHFGKIFYNQAVLSAERIPQVSVVMGFCTAGGAYIPAMSDESIIVKDTGSIFLAGPPLVEAATGEIVTIEELGGAFVHTSISGVADHFAENEEHALSLCRDIFQHFNKTQKQHLDRIDPKEPQYPVNEIYGLIPLSSKKAINIYEVIARLVDGSRLQEFKANYGKTIVTGFARIEGYNIGIIANNGILFSESTLKATHFIELCCSRNIPIVFLQNIAGFMVGKEYEHKGIAKDGAKMIQAVANANVPKFTIIIGTSSGAGNYAMAGRAFNSNLLFIWPNSRITVMGGEQASHVLESIRLKNGNNNLSADDNEILKQKILKDFDTESSSLYSTSRIWDDGIIDPADTRKVLAAAISMSLNRQFPEPKTGVYRM